MISILCPSRGRPELARKMADSALRLAEGKVQVFFYLNTDDEELNNYPVHEYKSFIGPDQPTTMSWNFLAKFAYQVTNPDYSSDLLMVCGDDVEFKTQGWDTKLKAQVPGDGYAIMSVYDGRGDDSHPHPIYTRKMYDALGYVMHPAWLHWHGDTWAAMLAKTLGLHVYCRDILVEHQKPSDTGEGDITHKRIRNGWMQARDKATWDSPAMNRAFDAEVLYLRGIIGMGA